jgi:hypothetical protein
MPRGVLYGIFATAGSNASHPLLYLDYAPVIADGKDKMGGDNTSYSLAATDFEVSADGGKTWQQAPQQGIPNGQDALRLIGMPADGSVVGEFSSNSVQNFDFNGSTLFIWKAGATSWQQLGPETVGNIVALVDVPDNSLYGKIYLLTDTGATGVSTGSVYRYQQ